MSDAKDWVNKDKEPTEQEIIWQGILSFKAGRIPEATSLLFTAIERLAARNEAVPASALALYGTCLAYQGKMKEGLDACNHAKAADPYNPEIYLNLARVFLRAESKRRAVSALNEGLALSPRHPELQALRRKLGARQSPVLPFLSRGNPLNVALGKARHRRSAKKKS